MSTARAVGTALHDRPELFGLPSRRSAELDPLGSLLPNEALLAPAVSLDPGGRRSGAREVEAILKGLDRSRSRIWVADRDLQVLARAGSLKPPPEPQQDGGWLQQSWHRLLAWLVPPPRQEYIEQVDQEPLARSPRSRVPSSVPAACGCEAPATGVRASSLRRNRYGSATRCSGWWWWKKRPIRFSVCAIRRSNA